MFPVWYTSYYYVYLHYKHCALILCLSKVHVLHMFEHKNVHSSTSPLRATTIKWMEGKEVKFTKDHKKIFLPFLEVTFLSYIDYHHK